MDRPDRRIEKTKAAIYKALNDLMQEKKYIHITIQEIIDRANVGRTTFYSHFTDKDELLSSYIEIVFESFQEQINNQPSGDSHPFIRVAALFTHIQQNQCLINGILMSEGGERLMDRFRDYWSKKIELYLLEYLPKGKQPKVPMDMLTDYVTGTLIELIRWWIKTRKRFTPEQMENYFELLVVPTIQSLMQWDTN